MKSSIDWPSMSEVGTAFFKAGSCMIALLALELTMSGGALGGASDLGPERASPSGGADVKDGEAVCRCLQLHGVAIALDLAGAAIGQCCDDLGFHLGAGARCLFLGFDGARSGGDEAID